MEITRRAEYWTAPSDYTGGTTVCDIKATHALTHSVSNRFGRKKAPAVAVCITTLGSKLHLCAHCLSFVEVLQWLHKIGHRNDLSTGALAALGHVWRAETGFVMPEIKAFSVERACRPARGSSRLVAPGKRVKTNAQSPISVVWWEIPRR